MSLSDIASSHVIHQGDGSTYLVPRPWARVAAPVILVPLLPQRAPVKSLPSEIWRVILAFTLEPDTKGARRWRDVKRVAFVCKMYMDIALTLFYTRVFMLSPSSLFAFASHLLISDRRWDSLRRIPYSTPGRWVKHFDLAFIYDAFTFSDISFALKDEIHRVNQAIAQLINLMPYLEALSLPRYAPTTRHVMDTVRLKDGIQDLQRLEIGLFGGDTMALAQLLRQSIRLDHLVVRFFEEDITDTLELMEGPSSAFPKLCPEYLHHLEVLSIPPQAFVTHLIKDAYPSLHELSIPPCSDFVLIISSMGSSLTSLTLLPDSSGWPSQPLPTPSSILILCPNLVFLSLIAPLPALALTRRHPLMELSLPRPNATFFKTLEALITKECLPNLKTINTYSTRYIRAALGVRALQAGVQGEMQEWRMRFERRDIQLVDSQGWDGK